MQMFLNIFLNSFLQAKVAEYQPRKKLSVLILKINNMFLIRNPGGKYGEFLFYY